MVACLTAVVLAAGVVAARRSFNPQQLIVLWSLRNSQIDGANCVIPRHLIIERVLHLWHLSQAITLRHLDGNRDFSHGQVPVIITLPANGQARNARWLMLRILACFPAADQDRQYDQIADDEHLKGVRHDASQHIHRMLQHCR
uniref:Secreted protein n=1 Tax=Kalanchoe fedtschenkoi TaxID=63787 RepID=A0A7N0U4S5_KALFE